MVRNWGNVWFLGAFTLKPKLLWAESAVEICTKGVCNRTL